MLLPFYDSRPNASHQMFQLLAHIIGSVCRCVCGWCLLKTVRARESEGERKRKRERKVGKASLIPISCNVFAFSAFMPEKDCIAGNLVTVSWLTTPCHVSVGRRWGTARPQPSRLIVDQTQRISATKQANRDEERWDLGFSPNSITR